MAGSALFLLGADAKSAGPASGRARSLRECALTRRLRFASARAVGWAHTERCSVGTCMERRLSLSPPSPVCAGELPAGRLLGAAEKRWTFWVIKKKIHTHTQGRILPLLPFSAKLHTVFPRTVRKVPPHTFLT